MLKVVKLEDVKHKDIICYIDNFKDSNDNLNPGEAILKLINLGFDKLTENENKLDISKIKEELLKEINLEKENIDLNSIKNEIKKDIIKEINYTPKENLDMVVLLNKLDNLASRQPYVEKSTIIDDSNSINPLNEKEELPKKTKSTPIRESKKVEIPVDVDPLMANILANANR